MSRRDLWKALYERFDPESPTTRSEWRAERPHHNPAQRIIASLDMPFGIPRILLAGTVGTGKSTELLRVAEARRDHELVVLLDLERHFNEIVRDHAALQRIQSWEVCFLAGLALIATLESRLQYQFPPEYLQDLQDAWSATAGATDTPPAQLDLAALTKSMLSLMATAAPAVVSGPVGTGIATGLSIAGGVTSAVSRWNLPLGLSRRTVPDQNKHVQTLVGCVNVLINEIQRQHRRVLFVIDGLDRIREVGRARELFVDSQLISQLDCPIVVCAPFALRHHPSTATVRGFEIRVLVNEPVLLQSDPSRKGPGVGFFCDLFMRRTADLQAEQLISRPLLEELAYRSGGRVRDFVRFIRELAKAAWQADAQVATEELVQEVLDDLRRTRELGLHKGHIQMLEEIANDPEHRLPAQPLAQELLDIQALLPYPNRSEWYYPHPLLTMSLIRPKPGGSAS